VQNLTWKWILFAALASMSLSAGAQPCPKVTSAGVGPVTIGSVLPATGLVRLRKLTVPTEGEDEIFDEFALDCGAHIQLQIESGIVSRMIVSDRRLADSAGVSVGMRFHEVIARLTEPEVLGGEEEGGYLTIRSRGIGYLFSLEGLPPGALANVGGPEVDFSHQPLDELLVSLP
jgi:hypothetical protein